jgi:deoxycytidylate deaminase
MARIYKQVRHVALAASLSQHPLYKVGAIIVKGNRILSRGYNKLRSHTKSTHPYRNLHAEIDAILRARTSLRGATMVIGRISRSGALLDSRPCEFCLQAISDANINDIYYILGGKLQHERIK